MSFLSELKKQKQRLRETETVVTHVDGSRFVENQNIVQLPKTYGFVVDTKPDDIPVLISDYLYIGSQDSASNNIIEQYNIKHVLSLGINLAVSVDNKFVECLDLPETNIKLVISECLPFVRNAVVLKENVLVHCNAGVSRTSMIAISYLMHYEHMNYSDAHNLVKKKRPAIRPNDGFKRQLMNMSPGFLIDT